VRRVILAKDGHGKLGFAVRSIDKGVFISFVWKGSAASLGGLRFCDQLLNVRPLLMAGVRTLLWLLLFFKRILACAEMRVATTSERDSLYCGRLMVTTWLDGRRNKSWPSSSQLARTASHWRFATVHGVGL
jgi:hypothetical protein